MTSDRFPLGGINQEQEHSIEKYLTEKHRFLENDYKTPDGEFAESCSLIAIDIARMLLREGRKPAIVMVTGKKREDESIVANKPLVPSRDEGRVVWGGHVICTCDGLAYDPMIGGVISLADYPNKAFGAEIDMNTIKEGDALVAFVKEVPVDQAK